MLEPPLPVLLDHDEAALGYASEMANKLRKNGGYNDPGLAISVMDEHRPFIFSIPILAACAWNLISLLATFMGRPGFKFGYSAIAVIDAHRFAGSVSPDCNNKENGRLLLWCRSYGRFLS
jgi:hypothetical protein